MSEIKLKKCPFCGGKADITYHDDYYGHRYYWIECLECDCRTSDYEGFDGMDKAVEAWNTRKPADEIMSGLKQLEEDYRYEPNSGFIDMCIDSVKEEL